MTTAARGPTPAADAGGSVVHDGPTLLDHLEDLERREAQRRRDEGVTVAHHATHTGWRLMAERVLGELADAGEPFTVDDLRQRVGHPLASSDNSMGALIAGAAKRGRIRAVGFAQSSRPESHGRWVRQWVGAGGGDG